MYSRADETNLGDFNTQKKLHTLTIESDRLKAETDARADLLTRIDAETRMVEEERAKAEQINKKYRQQLSDYKVGHTNILVRLPAGILEPTMVIQLHSSFIHYHRCQK